MYAPNTGYGVYIAEDVSIKYGGDFKIIGTFPIPLEEDRIYKLIGRVEEIKENLLDTEAEWRKAIVCN